MPVYELLVRTKDKLNLLDEIKNAHLTKRGDVIAIKIDKEVWWSQDELTNPHLVILKMELTEEQAFSLIAPETPPDQAREYKMLRKRGIHLNLEKLGITLPEEKRAESVEIKSAEVIQEAIIVKVRLLEPDQLVPSDSEFFTRFATIATSER